MNEFIETEFKYNAHAIGYVEFDAYVRTEFKPIRTLTVSGWDTYYANVQGDYLRHRYNSDHAEVTAKRRLSADSTASRVEVDVRILPDQADAVGTLAGLLGYNFAFTIYKTCHIYWTPRYNIVYYVVYNANMDELRRIVEIEADKSSTNPMLDIEGAEWRLWEEFSTISKYKRLNQSMYEMFK